MVILEQINAMLSFFETHPMMLFGTNSTAEGRTLSRRYWVECAKILNSVSRGCPTKTPAEWRTYYNELKSKTLKRVRAKRCFPAGKLGREIHLTAYQIKLYNLLEAHQTNLLKLQKEESLNNSLDISSTSDQQMPAQETTGQPYSLGDNLVSITFDDNSREDPLQSVKKESGWTAYDDSRTRASDIVEVSLGSHTDFPSNSYEALRKEDTGARVEERSVERAEELHKLQVAERIWAVKTMRERHATARLERELMQLRRDRADLELQRARRHQDADDQ